MWSSLTIGFQGALQGAGTPNQAGIGGFLPLSVGDNSVWFLDALVNAHFGDRDGYSSIINTDVAGGFSTSTRLGYRWLNSDRSWMYGLNAGYDSRSLKSGNTDTGVSVTNKKTVGFQQIALNAEAVSNGWTFNGYGLIPVGDVEQKLNSVYQGGALNTYGLDVGYFITPALQASVGYYYQHRDEEHVDGSGILDVSLMPSTTTSQLLPISPTTRRLILVLRRPHLALQYQWWSWQRHTENK